MTNTDGIILRVSKATGSIYGVNPDELIGRSVYDLEKEGLFTPLATPKVIIKKERITFVQTTKAGKKLLVTGVPVFDSNNNLYRIVSYSHDVTELLAMEKYLMEMNDEIKRVKSELERVRERNYQDEGIIANSSGMRRVMETSVQVAEVDVNVLLLGESGVGKSLIANYIHKKSPRKKGPFIEVNCGAIPETLFQSELFGYEGGSFTGANKNGKIGLVELAQGGTLFLDEIGELTLANQVKVLKFIQEKNFYRVGGTILKKADFRLITATNRNLEEMIKENLFREDLYFRLNVVPIVIPPLRERSEDIIPIINNLLKEFCEKHNKNRTIHEGVLKCLLSIEWKGNVRELINLIERLVVTSSNEVIMVEDLPATYISRNTDISTEKSLKEMVFDFEKMILTRVKKQYKTQKEIADALGTSQPSIVRKFKRYKI